SSWSRTEILKPKRSSKPGGSHTELGMYDAVIAGQGHEIETFGTDCFLGVVYDPKRKIAIAFGFHCGTISAQDYIEQCLPQVFKDLRTVMGREPDNFKAVITGGKNLDRITSGNLDSLEFLLEAMGITEIDKRLIPDNRKRAHLRFKVGVDEKPEIKFS
ncbi:MAG: hypothetical protein ABH950_01720, partial [Candidatus Altiarchaeota archaeon]